MRKKLALISTFGVLVMSIVLIAVGTYRLDPITYAPYLIALGAVGFVMTLAIVLSTDLMQLQRMGLKMEREILETRLLVHEQGLYTVRALTALARKTGTSTLEQEMKDEMH